MSIILSNHRILHCIFQWDWFAMTMHWAKLVNRALSPTDDRGPPLTCNFCSPRLRLSLNSNIPVARDKIVQSALINNSFKQLRTLELGSRWCRQSRPEFSIPLTQNEDHARTVIRGSRHGENTGCQGPSRRLNPKRHQDSH